LEQHLQAVVTLLALINPAVCAAIFARVEKGRPRTSMMSDAARSALAVLVILSLAALVGAKVLHAFGVSLDAFSVAGGGVLAWIGFSMLNSSPDDAKKPQTSASDSEASLTPLIVFAASPGTITGVITLAVAHSKLTIPVTALVAIGVATAVLWLVLMLVVYQASRTQENAKDDPQSKSGGFVRDTATRFMGLIVIAMGIQFALTGIKAFMNGP
jgi:multiple antibiotic resistance protein